MNDNTKIVKSLEENGLLIRGVTQRIKHEVKKQKGVFLGMLLSTRCQFIRESINR